MSSHLLVAENISKVVGSKNSKKMILDNITFSINRGEIIALLGANGAGKTTLSSLIASIHPPTKGTLFFEGQPIYEDICTYRKSIGYCPQKINLDNDLTVERNLRYAGLYMGLTPAQIKQKIEYFFDVYELGQFAQATPATLSGGYARRVLLARALMHDPKLLILDEPTVGLDPHIRHQLWTIINELKAQGVSVVLTTHYLDEAEYLSDRVCVLEKGRIRLIDTPAGLKSAYKKSSLEDVFIQLIKEESC